MYKVTDEQVDFLLNEVRARGVTIEDLQWNLVDHMCCIIEEEMSETDDFHQFFSTLLPRFFNDNLREIQEESELLLTFKHFYAMKKTLNISGLVAVVLTFFGAILKVMHWPGASPCIILGITSFSFVFLPLMIALKFKDETSKGDKLVLSFGFLIGIFTSLGFLAKIMHWPYANILMLSGLTAFIFVYVPLYFFTRFRKPELKFNTTVNTVLMMACGGLIFTMYNLGYSVKTEESSRQAYQLLNDEVQKISDPVLNIPANDSSGVLKLHRQIAKLNEEIRELKSNILFKSGKVTKTELDQAEELKAYNELPREESMSRITDPSIDQKWENIVTDFKAVNQQVQAQFPDQKELVFDIEKIDFLSNTSKIALQNLTLMQLHLKLLKLI